MQSITSFMPANLVYYSLVRHPPHSDQWVQSIRSLRRHNSQIPVHLFLYNAVADDPIRQEAARHSVVVHDLGDYRTSFAGHGHRQPGLTFFRTLHKFRHLSVLPPARQILYLDCDTYLFTDVEMLFTAYQDADWYAREEVMTRRNHHGYNPDWINEDTLARIAAANQARFVAPYNTGVCLMNHGVWATIAAQYEQFLDFAWRLLVGAQVKLGFHLPDVSAHFTAADFAQAIEYPTSSFWIFEEVAMWLMLGTIPGLTHDVLARRHVIQGGECDRLDPSAWLAHYWTNGEAAFFEKVGRQGV